MPTEKSTNLIKNIWKLKITLKCLSNALYLINYMMRPAPACLFYVQNARV